MNEKRKEFASFLEDCAARCKEQAALCARDGREDEAVFEKIKLNVYDIFKTVFNTLGEGEKFTQKLREIPAAGQLSLEKASAHGDDAKVHIESIKLEAAQKIEDKFKEIWGA